MTDKPWDAEEFARFRSDPKRQAMVRRILADDTRPATPAELEALKHGAALPDEAMVPVDWSSQ